MKYLKYILATLIVILTISATWITPKKHTESDFLLDTYVTITAYGKDSNSAIKKAMERVRELEKKLSAFYPESDVSRINSAEKGVPIKVSEECFFVLEQAVNLSEQTNGAFDVTIKPVMDLWGFGGETQKVPMQCEIDDAIKKVDYKNMILDRENRTVTLLKDGMAIDLGGIAKGYCADEAVEVLSKNGVKNAYLDFGGNIVTIGKKPLSFFDRIKYGTKEKSFVVGIQDPLAVRGEIFDTLTANYASYSVVTSGGYERYFEENGTSYHHILNPATGKQPENSILSVTITGESSLICDALSTALFVTGPDGCQMAEGLFHEIIFVFDSGEVTKIYSEGER